MATKLKGTKINVNRKTVLERQVNIQYQPQNWFEELVSEGKIKFP